MKFFNLCAQAGFFEVGCNQRLKQLGKPFKKIFPIIIILENSSPFDSPDDNVVECAEGVNFPAAGYELIEGRGSRIVFKRGDLRADFHRPHPRNKAKPHQVRAAREFLKKLEVAP